MMIRTTSVAETLALGAVIGELAAGGTCIALQGNLGAGKTQLTRGIALGAKVEDPTLVSSPTYVLLNIYTGPKPVYHLDAYRITSEEDFEVVGMEELLKDDGIVVVEWPGKIPDLLPADRLEIAIEPLAHEEHRRFAFRPSGPASKRLAEQIRKLWTKGSSRGL